MKPISCRTWWFERILHDVTAAIIVTEDEVLRVGQFPHRGKMSMRARQARAVLCWLMHEMTHATFRDIARLLGCHESQAARHCRAVDRDLQAGSGCFLFALQAVLSHARRSGPILGSDFSTDPSLTSGADGITTT